MTRGKSWETYKEECEAIAKPGITIKGFVGPWNSIHTKLICECSIHGEWRTTSICKFRSGKSCSKCGDLSIGKKNSKPDETHIADFMSTGKFHPETIFTKTDKYSPKGLHPLWSYRCPVCSNDEYAKAGLCSGVFESVGYSLKNGVLPCRCSNHPRLTKEQLEYCASKQCLANGFRFLRWVDKANGVRAPFYYLCPLHDKQKGTLHRFSQGKFCAECSGRNQQQAYITIIGDKDGFFDLKFGIARDSLRRLKEQKTKATSLRLFTEAIYDFPTIEACKSAERAVKQRLADYVGSVPAALMPDGHSETLPIGFMDQVKAIYLEFGGVLQKPSLKRPKRRKARKSKSVLLTT